MSSGHVAGRTRRRHPARSTSCCRTEDRSTRAASSPGWPRAPSPGSRRSRRRRSPDTCACRAVPPGSRCARTRRRACICAPASRGWATWPRWCRRCGASSTSMPTRSRSKRRSARTPSSRRSSPALRASACPGSADPHEMLIRAMVGQQITVVAARTAPHRPRRGSRGAHRQRPAVPDHDGDRRSAVPRCCVDRPARIRAITGAAAALADGSLRLTVGDDGTEQRAALLANAGVSAPGPADYVRMRVLGDPDVLLPGDVALRAGRWRRRACPGRPEHSRRGPSAPHRAAATSAHTSGAPPRCALPHLRRASAAHPAPTRDTTTKENLMTAILQTIRDPGRRLSRSSPTTVSGCWPPAGPPTSRRSSAGCPAAHRPEEFREGETEAAAAALAYYAGELSAIDAVAVKQSGTAHPARLAGRRFGRSSRASR